MNKINVDVNVRIITLAYWHCDTSARYFSTEQLSLEQRLEQWRMVGTLAWLVYREEFHMEEEISTALNTEVSTQPWDWQTGEILFNQEFQI